MMILKESEKRLSTDPPPLPPFNPARRSATVTPFSRSRVDPQIQRVKTKKINRQSEEIPLVRLSTPRVTPLRTRTDNRSPRINQDNNEQNAESMLSIDSPVIEGKVRINGQTERWAKLTLYKIDLWPDEKLSFLVDPYERISLGLKKLEVIKSTIKLTDQLRDSDVTIRPVDLSLFQSWVDAIQSVINLYEDIAKRDKMYMVRRWVVQHLKIWTGTWNVGNTPPGSNLKDWIPSSNYHLIAIGSQECTYGVLSVDDWFGKVTAAVGNNYIPFAKESLWEMRNIVFARKDIIGFIHSISKGSIGTGIANIAGNKGGIGIRFFVCDTSICMITAHLAAHQTETGARNEDYSEIISNLKLKEINGKQQENNHIDIMNESNYCFIYGDLNYRLDAEREVVLQWINEGSIDKLLEVDQLTRERKLGKVFSGWNERPPTFRPTYRYERNSIQGGHRVYSEEKMRVMSWCDRVLYYAHPGCEIVQDEYDCCDSITSSDHSPVFATFRIYARLQPSAPRAFNPNYIRPKLKKKNTPKLRFIDVQITFDNSTTKLIYIKFVGSFLPNRKFKSPLLKTSTPCWETLKLPIDVLEKEYMQTQQVLCIVVNKLLGPNVVIGQGTLGLENACEGQLVPFEIPIYDRGLAIGSITGKVQITNLVSMKTELDNLQF